MQFKDREENGFNLKRIENQLQSLNGSGTVITNNILRLEYPTEDSRNLSYEPLKKIFLLLSEYFLKERIFDFHLKALELLSNNPDIFGNIPPFFFKCYSIISNNGNEKYLMPKHITV